MREYDAADRNIDRLEQKIERQKAVAKERVESRGRTAMRHNIQNVVNELNSLLEANDKKRHVPDNLKKAVAEAKGEISDLALEIAQKMIGKSLDGNDQKRLVDSFIDELGEQL